MARLKMSARKGLPKRDFAVPSKAPRSGSYPIENANHAREALARSSGKPVQAEVERAVHRKYPSMGKGEGSGPREGHAGSVPRGEHQKPGHREPRSHEEFHKLGNKGGY